MDAFDTIDYRGFVIELHYDDDPINMREDCDNEGSLLVQLDDRFYAPSKHDQNDWRYDKIVDAWDRTRDYATIERYARTFLDAAGFDTWNAPRDSSRVVCLVFSDSDYTEPQAAATAIVREYGDWSEGEVYGYVITESGQEINDLTSSVWGFVGDAGAVDMIEQAKAEVDAIVTVRHANTVKMFKRMVNGN